MTQQYADSFIVTSGFNTTGGEAVPQTVIFQFGDVELRHQTIVIVTIRAWFCWTLIISKHIKIFIDHLFQRFNHRQQLLAHRNFAAGVFCFGCVDDQLRMLFLTLNDIDAFNRATDRYCSICHIDVDTLQSAYFSNAQPGTKADMNSQPRKGKVALNVVQNLSVIGDRQHFQFLAGGGRGVFYIPFVVSHPFIFNSELHHHFKDYQNVLYCFDT